MCFLLCRYLFHQLAVVLFDFDADRNFREPLEHILQQRELPVCTAAVVTCRKRTHLTNHLLHKRIINERWNSPA